MQGRVSGMLSAVPVYAVLVDDLGERGAHFMASKLLYEREARSHEKKWEITSSGEFIRNQHFGISWVSVAAGAGAALLLVWLRNKRS